MSLFKSLLSTKEEPIRSNEDFWNWFQKHERYFFKTVKSSKRIEKNFFNKMAPKLAELREGYFYLTGMMDENTAELVLTADGIITNIVFVEDLVAAAPAIPGWKFTALKAPIDTDDFRINMGNYVFGTETLSFYSNDDPAYPDEIDITIVH